MHNYGFEYCLEGRNFTFAVVADGPESAKSMVRAMAGSELVGRFVESPPCLRVNPPIGEALPADVLQRDVGAIAVIEA
jgi:hypothetical protein